MQTAMIQTESITERHKNIKNENHTQFSKNSFAFIPAEIQKGWPHNRHCCLFLVAPKSLSSLQNKNSKLQKYIQKVPHLEIYLLRFKTNKNISQSYLTTTFQLLTNEEQNNHLGAYYSSLWQWKKHSLESHTPLVSRSSFQLISCVILGKLAYLAYVLHTSVKHR